MLARFRDDIIVNVRSPEFCPKIFGALSDGNGPLYRVERESFSLIAVPMLDMLVFKASFAGATKLVYKPYIKPSARHIPWGSVSSRSWGCHLAWPKAEVQCMFDRSFFRKHFEEFRELKVSRFQAFFLCPFGVEKALNCTPRLVPLSGASVELSALPARRQVVRLILPFSKRWAGLDSKLKSLRRMRSHVFAMLGVEFEIGLSFSRGRKPLWQIVRLPVSADLNVLSQVASAVGRSG